MNCRPCDAGVLAVKRTVVPIVLASGEVVYWRLKADTYKAVGSHFTPQPWYSGIVKLYRRIRRWVLKFFGIHTCDTPSGIHPRFSMNYRRDNGLQKTTR